MNNDTAISLHNNQIVYLLSQWGNNHPRRGQIFWRKEEIKTVWKGIRGPSQFSSLRANLNIDKIGMDSYSRNPGLSQKVTVKLKSGLIVRPEDIEITPPTGAEIVG